MSKSLPENLIRLEQTAWSAWRAVGDVGQDYPPRPADWTPEQHAVWDVAWQACQAAAVAVQAGITAHAAETGQSRYELEVAVKRAVRHPAAA